MAGVLTSASLGPPIRPTGGTSLPTSTGTATTGGPPAMPAQPSLQQLTPTTPATAMGTVTNAAAGTVGTAPTAQASNVGPLAAIKGGQMNPNDASNAASQVAAITNQNSPYIQQAIQQGLLSAASRGLENSSLGAGAAEASAVQAAAPLAQQNAGEAANAAMQNSQLQTQAGEFNASQQNANQQLQAQIATQANQFNAAQQAQNSQFNAQAMNQMRSQTQALTEQLNQQFLSGSQAQTLASIQGQWNSFIQSNTSAAQLYQQTLQGVSAILNNKDIDPTRAGTAITTLLNTLQGAFKVMNAVEGGTAGPAPAVPGAPPPPGTSPPVVAPRIPTPTVGPGFGII